jgi:putative spermidine/putrescine transport system substrate-binding protein
MRTRLIVLTGVLALIAAACGGASTATTEAGSALPTEVGEGEGQVNIIAWAGYIENGSTDPAYDWVTQFTTDTGCAVNVKVAGTSDEMVALMTEGGGQYDLVTASGDASLRLIKGGTVQEVNTALIPSYSTVDERLQNGSWHTVDGKHYGTPYQWGANVLMYNTDVFPEAPASWSVLFEEQILPDGASNEGRIEAYDGAIAIADAALYLMSKDPSLGITDPYALTADQFTAVGAVLRAQREIAFKYWHDVVAQMEDFKSEGVVAASSWPYQVNLLQFEGAPIASTIPSEGATGWADTTMMHAQAPNPNCAYKWMEHSLSPKVQGDVAAWFGSVPAVPAACTGNELLTDAGCATNGFDNFDRIAFWKTPQADCFGAGGECLSYSQWVSSYTAILGGQ